MSNNRNDNKMRTSSAKDIVVDKSQILIQNDLPQHKMSSDAGQIPQKTPLVAGSKEKWKSLKSNLQSAVEDWVELEKQVPAKSVEDAQLDKMRSLITDLKERLAEF